jgi:hypothetical protein
MKILVVDVGGTHVKILATGQRVHRQVDSGPAMTAGGEPREASTANPARRQRERFPRWLPPLGRRADGEASMTDPAVETAAAPVEDR